MGRNALIGLVCAAAVVAACGTVDAGPSTTDSTAPPAGSTTTQGGRSTTTIPPSQPDDPTVTWTRAPDVMRVSTVDFPDAGSIATFAAPDGRIHVAFGVGATIHHAVSDDGATFSDPVPVNEVDAFVIPFERPALFVDRSGAIWVAHPTAELDGSIVVSTSADGGSTFATLGRVSGTPAFETVLPRFTAGADGHPALAWLADSTARLLGDPTSGDDPTVIDDRVCECCSPAPVVVGDEMVVAYRDLDEDGTGVFRDIAVAVSADGGDTFGSAVRVSDRHWYIDACPISGPTAVSDGEALHVLWMDGRNDDGSFRYTDIWVASSSDGGATFTPDRRLNSETGIYHGRAEAALHEGVVHVVWDSRNGPDGEALHYSRSNDGGATFTSPVVLTGTEMGSGARPGNVSLAVLDDARIVVTWVDGDGGHLGVWGPG